MVATTWSIWSLALLVAVGFNFTCSARRRRCATTGWPGGAARPAAPGGSWRAALDFTKTVLIPECWQSFCWGAFKLQECIDRTLDVSVDLSRFELANNKLFIQTTKMPFFEPVLLSSYESEKDLKTSLMASCAAFPFSNLVKRIDGAWYIDGIYSGFQPRLSPSTITVSPLYFSTADIKPSRYLPLMWTLFPPKDPSTVDWLFDLGYVDCLRWMYKHDYRCTHTHEVNAYGGKQSGNIGEDQNNTITEDSDDHLPFLLCSKRLKREPHPYDVHQKRSFQRYFGYGQTCWALDLLFCFLLYALLKPLGVFLVWAEMVVSAGFVAIKAIWKELFSVSSLLLVPTAVLLVFSSTFDTHFRFVSCMSILLLIAVFHTIGASPLFGALFSSSSCVINNHQEEWGKCQKYILAALKNLLLCKRCILASTVLPEQYLEFLQTYSVAFRLFQHVLL